ncbi:putative TrmH family tRNA/rRNA methyltransferase [Spirochaetia bacterium]|nr:putative TrmH family tRNA/rRNA methyltransferase [Spirochaetia bacterium]
MKRLVINAENSEYQIIHSLKLNRIKRNKLHEIFIEGIECIKQAINSNAEITRIIIKDTEKLSNWGQDVIKKYKNAKIIEMSNELYNNLTEKINPSEMLITAKIKQNTINDISSENPFIILFDRPSDYGNLGSIIRSANAFNVDGIIIIGHGIDIYESKVIRASLGSIFFTKIVTMESMDKLLEYIKMQKKKNNIEVIGTDSTGTISLNEYKLARPIMLIIGNEAKGMSIKLKEVCDKIIKIPMDGNINSLNVSCAASIMMWEIYKNKI